MSVIRKNMYGTGLQMEIEKSLCLTVNALALKKHGRNIKMTGLERAMTKVKQKRNNFRYKYGEVGERTMAMNICIDILKEELAREQGKCELDEAREKQSRDLLNDGYFLIGWDGENWKPISKKEGEE